MNILCFLSCAFFYGTYIKENDITSISFTLPENSEPWGTSAIVDWKLLNSIEFKAIYKFCITLANPPVSILLF